MLTPEQNELLGMFPEVLQNLIQDELQAGNRIVEMAGGFPAPPIGKFVRLANPVSTRPRTSDGEVNYLTRNFGSYCGEFTDDARIFFVIESRQLEAGAYPDMNAIRDEMEARQRAADADMSRSSRS